MANLILVEDDITIRNGIYNYFDWNAYGLDMIQTAESAEVALEICKDFAPDIIISDIRMGEMNGVDLCLELRRKYPKCQIIFISGYADKEYLMAAIQLQAVSYVEKPINREALSEAIGKAVREVNKENENIIQKEIVYSNFIRKNLFVQLFQDEVSNTNKIADFLKNANHFSENSSYRLVICRCSKPVMNLTLFKNTLLDYFDMSTLEINVIALDNRNICLLLCSDSELMRDKKSICLSLEQIAKNREICGLKMFMAFGCIVKDLSLINYSYLSAQDSIKNLFYLGYGNVSYDKFVENDQPLIFPKKILQEFSEALDLLNENKAVEIIDSIYQDIIQNEIGTIEQITNIYYTIFHETENAINLSINVKDENSIVVGWRKLEEIDSFLQIHNFVKNKIQVACEEIRKSKNDNEVINTVHNKIKLQYNNPQLSIGLLADDVGLNPTYLAFLFKKKTGGTIGQYITDYRMNIAKKLLVTTNDKLSIIAEKTGYIDGNYFLKNFKKIVGKTPTEYREINS